MPLPQGSFVLLDGELIGYPPCIFIANCNDDEVDIYDASDIFFAPFDCSGGFYDFAPCEIHSSLYWGNTRSIIENHLKINGFTDTENLRTHIEDMLCEMKHHGVYISSYANRYLESEQWRNDFKHLFENGATTE